MGARLYSMDFTRGRLDTRIREEENQEVNGENLCSRDAHVRAEGGVSTPNFTT